MKYQTTITPEEAGKKCRLQGRSIRRFLMTLSCIAITIGAPAGAICATSQPITDTGQKLCYNNSTVISCPKEGEPFYGQDGNYISNPQAYHDNGDGTVTDMVTGLMWSKAVNAEKLSLEEAQKAVKEMTLGGYSDWRVPNIKELYSLMNFSGRTGTREMAGDDGVPSDAVPYINTDYFDFRYGQMSKGDRFMDAQWLSATQYVSTTMDGNPTLFGVNFADGRIKGYPNGVSHGARGEKKYYVRFVRGSHYGSNHFRDKGDGTITDEATGLTWLQADSGKAMSWEEALSYAENSQYAGHSDWRLPDAKELQYLVDYNRSPDTTDSAAIDSIFQSTAITNEAKEKDYPYYWTSTTHLDGPRMSGVYVCFGRAIGAMHGRIMDVHGAGAQRSDPKVGTPGLSHAPQGDALRIKNFVRLVRGGQVARASGSVLQSPDHYPNKVSYTRDTGQPVRERYMPGTSQGGKRELGQRSFGNGRRFFGMRRPGANDGSRFIKRLDRDGDNKVSPREFDGPANQFSRFDRNNDGFISTNEAPTGPPPRRDQR